MNKEPKKNEQIKKIIFSIIAIILIVAIGVVIYFNYFKSNEEPIDTELAYTELLTKINNNEISKIEMTVGSTSLKVSIKDDEKETEYRTIIPNTQAFVELLQDKMLNEGVDLELIQKKPNAFFTVLDTFMSMLPTILLVVLIIMVFKMQGLGDKGKVYGEDTDNKTNVTFEDVAGLDEEKAELVEIVEFLKKPEKYRQMGAKIPRGVLLCGKPGTGKTLIAKAIAGEAGVPFISMSGSEFIEMFVGLGASRVRKLFERAKKISPCIIFIDEIDAIGTRRTSSSGAETENNQTLNQLLVEMDGFETDETVIVLAATNRPEMLDKALLRPGRFDRQIVIASPDRKGREEILKIHSKNKNLSEDIDLSEIAGDTAGFTGAELNNILNEAAIIATRNEHEKIQQFDIDEAVKKVTVGLEKTSRKVSEKDKKLTAYHEAGHALVSKFLPTQEPVKEISIIPRGYAGGYTMYKTIEDKAYISRTEMEERLVALLGGRAAEKVALNDISTGAGSDIKVATEIARDMVTVYGMDDVIGPLYLKVEDGYEPKTIGDGIENTVGLEIKKLIDRADARAQQILRENIHLLDKIATELLSKEKLTEKEFEEIFK